MKAYSMRSRKNTCRVDRSGEGCLSQRIRETVKDYKKQGKSPEYINTGECELFADKVIKRFPYAEYGSTDDYTDLNETALIGGKRAAFLGHTWITYKGKHFDAEAPKGVNRWFDLPIFHRSSTLATWSTKEKKRIKWE